MMNREEFIGNVTTVGKILICTFGTPSMVSFVSSNEYVILVSALFGIIWAFYDSKYFNTFFKGKAKTTEIMDHDGAAEYEDLNMDYSAGDD